MYIAFIKTYVMLLLVWINCSLLLTATIHIHESAFSDKNTYQCSTSIVNTVPQSTNTKDTPLINIYLSFEVFLYTYIDVSVLFPCIFMFLSVWLHFLNPHCGDAFCSAIEGWSFFMCVLEGLYAMPLWRRSCLWAERWRADSRENMEIAVISPGSLILRLGR